MTQNSKSIISGRALAISLGACLVVGGIFALGMQASGDKADRKIVQAPEAPALSERPPIAATLPVESETANLQRLLARVNGSAPALKVTDSVIPGLKRVEITGGPVVYLSADGKHLVEGRVLDISGEEPVDPDQAQLSAAAKELIDAVPASEWIAFGPEKPTTSIYVLTDLDCTYCRKLHGEVPMLHALGVQVRYLAYPRHGEGSPSWVKAESVWCADDRKAALELAKSGADVPAATCDSPVAKHYAIGQALRVEGTPTIILENGTILEGYRPASELAKAALANRAK